MMLVLLLYVYGPWRRDCADRDGDDVVVDVDDVDVDVDDVDVDVDDVDGQHQHCAGNGPWRADKDDPSNLWSHYNPLLKQNEGIKTGNNDCKESIPAL